MNKAICLDIDGTLVAQESDYDENQICELLSGTKEKMDEWYDKGYRIILTTGRGERLREKTIKELSDLGLRFHDLLMDVPSMRYLINNKSTNGTVRAFAFSPNKNEGIKDIDI